MPQDETPLATLPPAVRAFVQSHRLPSDAVRPEGRVVLNIDQRWRVHLVSTAHMRVALQCELMALPEPTDRRTDDALLRLAKVAANLLQRRASSLAIDPRRRALVLQQLVSASATLADLEEALADFSNALEFWSRMCRNEPAQHIGIHP
ncbi:MAG: CesT family type III secretion system chaperone [Ramlibacter sp.]